MDVARVCSDLVQINTENPPGRTDEAVEYIAGILENLGYRPPGSLKIPAVTGMSVPARAIAVCFFAVTWMWCPQGRRAGRMTLSPV
ncbi:hypothetical protein [Methanogenium cariaci]|uniref:hypothetical protein n=1 Tax=Methanogenium cariaci TaxID=2197 RepID=UPI000780C97C|nr:hypothetical protein [Methanogenium cariaci]